MQSFNMNRTPFSGEALWIWGKGGNWQQRMNPSSPFRVCYFKKMFSISDEGARLTVHVSADSRYTLFVNGIMVCTGPAKGDIAHQFYDTIVLDSYLKQGENIISAVVICFAAAYPDYSELGVPLSIMTATPAFILDGVVTDHSGEKVLESMHTNKTWNSLIDLSYGHHRSKNILGIVSGLGEDLSYDNYPEGWHLNCDSGHEWYPAEELAPGVTKETVMDSQLPFRLTPRMIPMMREENREFTCVYSVNSISFEDVQDCIKKNKINVQPWQTVSFILDAGELTTAYPVIEFEKGRASEVKITYSEALYKDGKKTVQKVNDGDIEGLYDCFICDGKNHLYEPMHWRTFRYIKVDIVTGPEMLVLGKISYRFTGYPLDMKAAFSSSDERHKKLWSMTFRTLQLCCHETFEDCPYYEQNQYSGDSQIVSLVMGYMTGDWSLARQAIMMFSWSADYEGITKSRYPNRVPQIIPTWSLLWIVMVYEYWLHTGDIETVYKCKKILRSTLEWFEEFLNDRYLLEKLNYWTVVDWVKEWDNPPGNPPGSKGGETGLITAQYAYCLKLAAELFKILRLGPISEHYEILYRKIAEGINQYCWDEDKGLYKDCPQYERYSELGNAWPIIAGCAPKERAVAICGQYNRNPLLAKSTLYGRYYVFRALEKGAGYHMISELLEWWYTMMDSDLTTWPEEPWLARSYCHAWSCSPGYEFLAGVLGVKPAKAGFEQVIIAPQICGLKWARGAVPTAKGMIPISWEVIDENIVINLELPEGCTADVHVPKLNNKNTRVYENGRTILDADGYYGGVRGINNAYFDNGCAVINISPGRYFFRMQNI